MGFEKRNTCSYTAFAPGRVSQIQQSTSIPLPLGSNSTLYTLQPQSGKTRYPVYRWWKLFPLFRQSTAGIFSASLEMVAPKSPDWIPAGWIEQVKVTNGRKLKYYYNSETGQKFNTKKDLIQYVERVNLCRDEPQQTSKLNESSSEPILEQNKRSSGRKNKRSSEPEHKEGGSEPMPEEKGRSEPMPEEKGRSEPMPEHNEKSSEPMPPAIETDETPEWLPQGWIMEVKVKSGSLRKYKCFVDQLSGRKFYSRPQVFEYLKTAKLDSSSQQKKMGNGSVSNADMGELAEGETSSKVEGSDNINTLEGASRASKPKRKGLGKKLVKKKVVIERVTAEGLPPGWIKEIKIQMKSQGIRRDPYYTDPVSGYVFRSQRDALRYLETGETSVCAIKPKKREELSFLTEGTSVSECPEQ
ncbi:uncharacterized protein LOC131332397 isoform X1 [Rhododendron vialii]|uniref:uncharacterized protein LOC131332397 isoform X1 n=1 Tax=Rhododendron vialii TaxID=182163 RepID=UPI00265F8592|nr:uncharacterized protein LOC131332397 isoform X1 [Rhododendron vialii]